jgi:hypothetical protein
MKLHRWWSLLLILLVLASCTPTPRPGVTVTPLQPDPVPTLVLARITPTLNPTLTETLPHPTEQFIFYDTPAPPTSTPTITITPTAYIWPTAYPYGSLSLPGWASNPDTPILLGWYKVSTNDNSDEDKNLALWNGRSGDRYDIDIPGIDKYFWLGKSAFGLLVKPMVEPAILRVDLTSGAMTKQAINSDVYNNLVKSKPGGISWPQKSGLSGNSGYPLNRLSIPESQTTKDGHFRWDKENWKITVYDSLTGDSYIPTDPARGLYDIWADWSPVAPYLAVFNSDVEVNIGIGISSEVPVKYTVSVYDVPNRRLVNTFSDIMMDTGRNWSLDGLYILSQSALTQNEYYEEPPCVLNVVSGKKYCYYDLLSDLMSVHTQNIYKVTHIMYFNWMPDSQGISFLYFTYELNLLSNSGGVCIIRFGKDSKQCFVESPPDAAPIPTDNYPLAVVNYWPDPGWNVMLFELSRCGPACEMHKSPEEFGFVDLNTGKLIMLDGAPEVYGSLWRP